MSEARPTRRDWPRGMRLEDAADYVGLSPSTWLALVEKGEAPEAVKLTKRRAVWYREDLDRWLDQKAGRGQSSEEDDLLAAIDEEAA